MVFQKHESKDNKHDTHPTQVLQYSNPLVDLEEQNIALDSNTLPVVDMDYHNSKYLDSAKKESLSPIQILDIDDTKSS